MLGDDETLIPGTVSGALAHRAQSGEDGFTSHELHHDHDSGISTVWVVLIVVAAVLLTYIVLGLLVYLASRLTRVEQLLLRRMKYMGQKTANLVSQASGAIAEMATQDPETGLHEVQDYRYCEPEVIYDYDDSAEGDDFDHDSLPPSQESPQEGVGRRLRLSDVHVTIPAEAGINTNTADAFTLPGPRSEGGRWAPRNRSYPISVNNNNNNNNQTQPTPSAPRYSASYPSQPIRRDGYRQQQQPNYSRQAKHRPPNYSKTPPPSSTSTGRLVSNVAAGRRSYTSSPSSSSRSSSSGPINNGPKRSLSTDFGGPMRPTVARLRSARSGTSDNTPRVAASSAGGGGNDAAIVVGVASGAGTGDKGKPLRLVE